MEEQFQLSLEKLSTKLSSWIDALILNLPNFLVATIVFTVAYLVSKKVQRWSDDILSKIVQQSSIRGLLSNIISIAVIVLGLLLALAILNLDGTLQSLLAGAGVAGLAISLALQGTLSNTFSGIFIAVKKELNVGDWVESNGFAGTVVAIDLRNTKIKESDNNVVVVPNKLIMDKPFKNYGLTKQIRATIHCGVSYDSDLAQVKAIAIKAVEALYPPNDDKNIEFFYTNFGDSSIDFFIRFWVDAKKKITALEVKSNAVMAIKEAFDDNGIEIPFPIRTVINEKTEVMQENDFQYA